MWPRFDSQTWGNMWVEFFGSLLCSERFSPGSPVFPFPQKATFDKLACESAECRDMRESSIVLCLILPLNSNRQ